MRKVKFSKSTSPSNRLDVKQKLILCDFAAQSKWSQNKLAAWATSQFTLAKPLSRGGVRNILSSECALRQLDASYAHQKNMRRNPLMQFDSHLVDLLEDFDQIGAVSGAIAVEAAKYLASKMKIPLSAQPSFSNGWLHRFQVRNGLSFKKRHGESGSVDLEAAQAGREKLKTIIADYPLWNVFNMDETSFFYRQDPTGSISRAEQAGRKQSKLRMTLVVGTNADGSEKLPFLIIGKAQRPMDLRGHDVGEEYGIDYTNSGKGWMTSDIYCDWLAKLDEKMRDEGRHILLLVDNVSSHDDSKITLTNIRVEKLPPNTTALLQPMDQGVIAAVKRRYMQKKTAATLKLFLAKKDSVDDPSSPYRPSPVGLDSAIGWVSEAWAELPSETIANCWRHAGLVSRKRKVTQLLNPF